MARTVAPYQQSTAHLTLGHGKRLLPSGVHRTFALTSATPYPSSVVELHYARQRGQE